MRRRILILLSAMIATFMATGAVTASAAPIEPSDVEAAAGWDCDRGGILESDRDSGGWDVYDGCTKSSGGSVSAYFAAYGEVITICDNFPNGHATWVWVTVEGHGTDAYRSYGSDSCTTEPDPNYHEGKDVSIKVCTSNTDAAKCAVEYGGRS